MPFFPQAYLAPEVNFFQLLSELDQPQQHQRKSCGPRQARSFTPRFDVTEVADAYELYGELPGVAQKDISIEFSDAQTIVIKGKSQRHLIKESAPAAEAEHENEKEVEADVASEKSHNATVEEDYDEADTPLETPATTATVAAEAGKPAVTETAKPKTKLWVAERKTGEFARSFSFEQRLEHDGVKASLSNGILLVVVPKSQKPKNVSVSIN